MKRTYSKIIVREIKGSFGRFVAIFSIVALGVGFLSGLLVTTPDMHLTVDKYYDKNNVADIFIKSTMGLTKDDMNVLSDMEYIDEIMPAFVTDTLMETEENEIIATRIYGLDLINKFNNKNYLNRLTLIEGRLPQKKDECLVEIGGTFLSNYKVGTKFTISKENDNYDDIPDIYNTTEFTVVGIVSNPFHFSKERERSNVGNGRLGTIIYVDEDSYALDVYTDFYLTVKDVKELNTFSAEYEEKIENIVQKLEELGKDRSLIRYNDVLAEAKEKLEDGKREYEEGKLKAEQELADALKKIEDGKVELSDAFKKLIDGEKELADAKETLEQETIDAQKEIEDAKKKLADALIELEDGEKELADAWIELQDGQSEYLKGYAEYLDAKRELEQAQEEFDKGEKEYLDGLKELEDAKRKIRRGERELEKGREELEAGEAELAKGIRELNANKAKFEELMAPIASAIGYSSGDELFKAMEGDSTGAIKGALDVVLAQMIGGIENQIIELENTKLQLEAGINEMESKIAFLKSLEILDDEQQEQLAYLESELAKYNLQLSNLNNGLQTLYSNLEVFPKNSDILYGNWKAIKNGESQLNYARRELERGWDKYFDGRDEMKEGKREIEKAEKKLIKAGEELEENRTKLKDAWAELEEGRIKLEDARIELEDGYKKYYDGRKELDDGWKEYNDGVKELADAEKKFQEEIEKANREIRDAEIELAKGKRDYKEGLLELSDGEREYLEAKLEVEQELADALKDIEEAEKEINDLEIPEWYVLDRDSNISYVSFEMNSEKVAAVAKVFPIFFYLISALVSLTTMTRMVEEERIQIGTLKALGYTKGSIILKYIIYCGLASVLGSIFGLVVGFKVLPIIIYDAYNTLFHLPEFIAPFNANIAIVSSGLAILSTIGATIYACNEALKEKPSTLMLPRAPKAGKRILLEHVTFIWSRMSFNAKSTARNIFRYKKHFFMTVIGISGCTALLLTGFGLRDSIGIVATKQYVDIFKYDVQIDLDEDKSKDDLVSFLNEDSRVEDYLEVYIDQGEVTYDEDLEVSIFVYEDKQIFSKFVSLIERKTAEGIKLSDSSVVITEKISEILGLKIGDKFKLENSDGHISEFTVTDITENYLGNYVYFNEKMYKKEFQSEKVINKILVDTINLSPNMQDEFIGELLSNEAIMNAEFISQTKTTFDNLLNSINYIVIVIIIASGALAFIVLYNLNNININERRKELATLKVLGFHHEEVAAYIFRETSILCIIGTLVGLVLGRLLHSFVILTVENPEFMFGRDISRLSYVMAGFITIIFSVIVNIFMYRKLKNIEMVDSMKAND